MDDSTPRLTSVMGVARALLATVGVREAVAVLVVEYGWDVAFQALSLLRGEAAAEAFGVAWEHLVTDPLEREMDATPSAWLLEG